MCWLSIYFKISSSSLPQVVLVNTVVCFCCTTPSRQKKLKDMKEETWKELDEKVLRAIQFCLTDEVLDEFSTEKTASSLWERLQVHYLKKSMANRLIPKQRLFILSMYEGTHIKSHNVKFFSIINDLR